MTHAIKALAAASLLALSGAAAAHAEGSWMVRARALGVLPNESADLSAGGTALVGDVEINDSIVPELDITYFLNDNFAFELILGTTPHDVETKGLVAPAPVGELGTVDLGKVWLLPPTLTAQYHFTEMGPFKPYIGAGLNYTIFYSADEGPVADKVSYEDSFGYALQAGFDYDLDGVAGGWALNMDVKRLWLNTDVKVNVTTALGAALGADPVIVDADVDINPWIVGIGAGYRF